MSRNVFWEGKTNDCFLPPAGWVIIVVATLFWIGCMVWGSM